MLPVHSTNRREHGEWQRRPNWRSTLRLQLTRSDRWTSKPLPQPVPVLQYFSDSAASLIRNNVDLQRGARLELVLSIAVAILKKHAMDSEDRMLD